MLRNKNLLTLFVLATFGSVLGSQAGIARSEESKAGANRVSPDADQRNQKKSPSADAVSELGLAYSLAQNGRANKSALALLAAAEILHRVPAAELAEKPKSEAGSAPAAASPEKKKKPEVTVDSLIAEAKQLAGNDPAILAMVAKAADKASETSRGALGGAKSGTTTVNALGTDAYTFAFRGGETAAIVVSGDHDTDLDLYVYDENGSLIAADDDGSDNCVVRFIPKWSGPFMVRVKNRGLVYNRYVIATN